MDLTFNSMEQYMMFRKAIVFGDLIMSAKIKKYKEKFDYS